MSIKKKALVATPAILKATLHKKGPGLQAPRVNRAQLSSDLKDEKTWCLLTRCKLGEECEGKLFLGVTFVLVDHFDRVLRL